MKQNFHIKHQKDLPIEMQILNISVNLARVSQWIADDYRSKRALIRRFTEQTETFLSDLSTQKVSKSFEPTLYRFTKEFTALKKEHLSEKNYLFWAERALTWANILQHRARLA